MDMKKAIQLATAQLQEMSASDYVARLRTIFESPITKAINELNSSVNGGIVRAKYSISKAYFESQVSTLKGIQKKGDYPSRESMRFFNSLEWKDKKKTEPTGSVCDLMACAA